MAPDYAFARGLMVASLGAVAGARSEQTPGAYHRATGYPGIASGTGSLCTADLMPGAAQGLGGRLGWGV